jgi:Protein of unknown function (DUF4012)
LKRKLLFSSIAAIAVLTAFGVYVGLSTRRELNAARAILRTPLSELSTDDVVEARRHLDAAKGILAGPPAKVLRLIPVARQNIRAVDALVDAGLPAMEDALALTELREVIGAQALVRDGRIRLDVLNQLNEPLQQQLESLKTLESELVSHRSGWLLPPLWDAVDDFARRTGELRSSLEKAADAIDAAPTLLGSEGRRSYLVMLVNNAELRAAGGILSGLGTITATNGRLALGRFSYYADLAEKPPGRVPAPADFERRFSRYRANTTTVVNATASPDIPEVAAVAAAIFEKVRGERVDGVLMIDPRGISSLMPNDSQTSVAQGDLDLTSDNLADFIYSDSYDVLGGGDPGRRSAILTAGRAAFKTILAGGASGSEVLESAGEALAGGHIRFVSFNETEDDILSRLEVTGNLVSESVDNVLITVQNLGADKLDYWMRRHLEHKCRILEATSARCETVLVLSNQTPQGLNDYVTQIDNRIKRSYGYGVYLGYLELYVPDAAELTGVTLNGRAETFFPESEDGRKSLGMYFATPRGEETTIRVSYQLPLPDAGYTLEITPQPLTFDASVEVEVEGPPEWALSGPGSQNNGRITFAGELDRALRFESRPDGRTGLAAAWRAFVQFWTQPVSL